MAQQRAPSIADSAFMPVGIDPAQLPDPASSGARLVARFCSQCHGIPSPASQAAADWDATLRRMLMHMERGHNMPGMGGMMRGMSGMRGMPMNAMQLPGDDDRATMLGYLKAHSMRSIAADEVPDRGSADAALFARTCNRCHALPDPAQHRPADWAAVVRRMRGNMVRFRIDTISDEDARRITEWLARRAAQRR